MKDEIVVRIDPQIRCVNDSLLEIWTSAGPGVLFLYFYDIQNDVFSEVFDSPLLHDGSTIVLIQSTDNQYYLVFRDIFSAESFYTTVLIDASPVANPYDAVGEITFLDEETIVITYLTGSEYDEKTEVINFAHRGVDTPGEYGEYHGQVINFMPE